MFVVPAGAPGGARACAFGEINGKETMFTPADGLVTAYSRCNGPGLVLNSNFSSVTAASLLTFCLLGFHWHPILLGNGPAEAALRLLLHELHDPWIGHMQHAMAASNGMAWLGSVSSSHEEAVLHAKDRQQLLHTMTLTW